MLQSVSWFPPPPFFKQKQKKFHKTTTDVDLHFVILYKCNFDKV